jgi:uncharacterized protein (DUF1778 family)
MERQSTINLYVTDDERKLFEKAAERAGLVLPSWIRRVALKAAEVEDGTGEKEPSDSIVES